jgi:hypothetical protein
MKSLTLLVAVIAIAVVAFPIGNAQAATYYFEQQDSTDWNDQDNWKTACSGGSPGAVPTASDDAVICSNTTADITDIAAVAKTVTVQLVSKIRILPTNADASLTLGSGASALTSSLTGPIELHAGTSPNEATLAFTSADHTLSGGSFVDGKDDDAQVSVLTSGKTLTLTAGIRGHLVIHGSGNFANQGAITANINGGTLKVAIGGTLSDTAGDRWKTAILSTTAKLLFDASIGTVGTLNGNFVIDNGTLEMDKAITTNGRLEQSNGTVQVDENFTLDNDDTGSNADITGGQILVAAGKQFLHK